MTKISKTCCGLLVSHFETYLTFGWGKFIAVISVPKIVIADHQCFNNKNIIQNDISTVGKCVKCIIMNISWTYVYLEYRSTAAGVRKPGVSPQGWSWAIIRNKRLLGRLNNNHVTHRVRILFFDFNMLVLGLCLSTKTAFQIIFVQVSLTCTRF